MEKGIHKLALVSKLLLDKEVIHLRQENEKLQLQLFWKDHNHSQLQYRMKEANQIANGPQCSCWSCVVSGRKEYNTDSLSRRTPCKFKLWLDDLLKQCGLIAAEIHDHVRPIGNHMSMDNGISPYDVDAHFLHIRHTDWCSWTYGSYLWKAESVDNPELAKLHALFVLMDQFIYLE